MDQRDPLLTLTLFLSALVNCGCFVTYDPIAATAAPGATATFLIGDVVAYAGAVGVVVAATTIVITSMYCC